MKNKNLTIIINAFPKRKVLIKNVGITEIQFKRICTFIYGIMVTGLLIILLYFLPEITSLFNKYRLLNTHPVEATNVLLEEKGYTSPSRAFYNYKFKFYVNNEVYTHTIYFRRNEISNLSENDLRIFYAKGRPDISLTWFEMQKYNYNIGYLIYLLGIFSCIFLLPLIIITYIDLSRQKKLNGYLGKAVKLKLFPVKITAQSKEPFQGHFSYKYSGCYDNKQVYSKTQFAVKTSYEAEAIYPHLSLFGYSLLPPTFKKIDFLRFKTLPFYIHDQDIALAVFLEEGVIPLLLDEKLNRLDLSLDGVVMSWKPKAR